jgi:hypothetical protein
MRSSAGVTSILTSLRRLFAKTKVGDIEMLQQLGAGCYEVRGANCSKWPKQFAT